MKSQSQPKPVEPPATASMSAPVETTAAPKARGKSLPLARIREMSLTELAYRGQQEATKLVERIAPIDSYPDPRALLEDRAPALASPDAALQWLRETAPQRFFAGVREIGRASCRERV